MKIFTIADIHFGAADEEKLYNELTNHFMKRVHEDKPDIIVIAGDSFDKKVTVDSSASIYFNKFIHDLTQTDSTIILIHGTLSHDRLQINAVSHYLSDKFFIVNVATKLYVKGMKLLILPEEYVNSMDYYDELLKDNYDFVFGHGNFKHCSFGGSNKIGQLNKKSYMFDVKQFKDNVKYYVAFGHIHKHSIFKNMIYIGSYSRTAFGEEEDKGFIIFDIDNKGKCKWEHVVNPDAPVYKTIHSKRLLEFTETEPFLTFLKTNAEKYDFLRILITDELEDNMFNNILGFVKNNDNTTFLKKTPNKIIESVEKNMEERQKVLKERLATYDGLSFIEITQKIAKDDYHVTFETEEIQRILNSQI